MIMELCSVFDAAARAYIEPFFAPTIEFALRGFQEACERPDHQFRKFPEDYTLYHIGTFHAEDGILEPVTPHKIGMASSFVHNVEGA